MEKKKIKIGIIYFGGIYLIHHFIGSVMELYKDPDCEVEILTPETKQDYLLSMLTLLNIPHSVVKKLPTYLYKKIAYKIQGRTKPSTRYIFIKNKKKLQEYDILIFNNFIHKYIDNDNRKLKFVFLMHGAGDRSYPFEEEYYPQIERFDLVTTSGSKINDLFAGMGDFKYTKFKSCGYQKLDIVRIENKEKKLFTNNKPIILYNPHFTEYISSFFKYGEKILDYFYNNKEYNLIFAPHFNLFDPQISEALSHDIIDEKYLKAPNMLIDLGSVNSVNMSYTLSADLYLGEGSSQVYEFLLNKLKPCVFINAFSVDWEKDKYYNQMWSLGKVIDNVDNLKEILDTRNTWQKDFEQKQRKAIDYTFDLSDDVTSSKRVANAIKALVNK